MFDIHHTIMVYKLWNIYIYINIIRNMTAIYLFSFIKYFERFNILPDLEINNEKKRVQVVNSHHHNKADDDLMAHKITF